MRCQVHNQQRTTENMSVEKQHGTESKHHLARTDRCSTSALSSASSTENNREHVSGEAAWNGVQASSCQNGASRSALSSASATENNREHASGAAARNGVQASSCQNGQVQHECIVKCIINREQQRTCQWSSSLEQSASIILPERTGAARVRCQVQHQQRTTENMPVEPQHGTESKHHLSRTDKCRAGRVRCQVHSQQRTTENMPMEQQSPSIILQERTSEARMRCQVRHQQRTCEWSSSAERSPSIILPERTGAAQVRCQVHHQQEKI